MSQFLSSLAIDQQFWIGVSVYLLIILFTLIFFRKRCAIGLHEWRYVKNDRGGKPMRRWCGRCLKDQVWDYEIARCEGVIVWRTLETTESKK